MTVDGTETTTGTTSGTTSGSELQGREAASLLRVVLTLTAGAAAVIGLVLYAANGSTDDHFAWRVADPATAVVLGAAFLGAVPMLLYAATRLLWEQLRVPAAAAFVLLVTLLAVTLADRDDLALSGALVPLALALAWLVGVGVLALAMAAALVAQAREPALPLARTAPLPRWTLPPVGVLGSALLGLGLGLLAEPRFWGPLVPWRVSPLDARMLGAWCLTLGVALLGALVEDDLSRLRPGLVGLASIGILGLLGIGWRHSHIAWSGWPAWLSLALVGGLAVTGLVGLALEHRAARPTARRRAPRSGA